MSGLLDDPAAGLTQALARRLHHLRADAGLSLAALAERSGVSRSMISLIERGESSPTAVVLDRLATALGLPLAALFEQPLPDASPLARAADQTPWRDPASGYLRRNVSPGLPGLSTQIVEVDLPPGAQVTYENLGRDRPVQQQVWVLEGQLQLRWGDSTWTLGPGDCLAMTLDRPSGFHNPTPRPTRYAVVITPGRP